MKRSITYRGYIETTMTSDTTEDYRNLACASAEAIIMAKSDFSYRSVTASVDNQGNWEDWEQRRKPTERWQTDMGGNIQIPRWVWPWERNSSPSVLAARLPGRPDDNKKPTYKLEQRGSEPPAEAPPAEEQPA